MIKGLSERRRMPRLGKIKLGVMVNKVPRRTDYFVAPPEVERVAGVKPKALSIMFPLDDPERLFPQELKCYRQSGLFCAGNGETARRWNEAGELVERPCPCELLDSGECGPSATLNFFLPDVPGVGVWQITTGSKRSIVSLNSALESYGRMFGGLAGIPFTLRLEPEQGQRWDESKNKMVKDTQFVMRLDSEMTLREILSRRQALGKPVEAFMLPAGEAARAEDAPTHPAEAQVDDIWTLFHDACGGNTAQALKLVRTKVRELFQREVEGLADLTREELAALAQAMTGGRT